MSPQYATAEAHDPEQLRRDIARTRADMDRTLAQLEDRVSPSRIRERQTQKVRGGMDRVRNAVMGAAPDTDHMRGRAAGMADSAGGSLSTAGDTLQQTPEKIGQGTRGNPLAAGLIAFGAGALLGAMLPPSRPEEELAGQLRENFEEPVKEQLQEAGQQVKEELQGHAQQAVEDTRQSAQRAMDETTSHAQDAKDQVQGGALDSVQHVREQR